MKKLKRMLLINWYYFEKEIIEFDTLTFLTGKNATGKSTIIDALQWGIPAAATLINRPTMARAEHWRAICGES